MLQSTPRQAFRVGRIIYFGVWGFTNTLLLRCKYFFEVLYKENINIRMMSFCENQIKTVQHACERERQRTSCSDFTSFFLFVLIVQVIVVAHRRENLSLFRYFSFNNLKAKWFNIMLIVKAMHNKWLNTTTIARTQYFTERRGSLRTASNCFGQNARYIQTTVFRYNWQ